MSDPKMLIEWWPTDKPIPYELNSKLHDEAQVEKIANAIQATGWDQPIVVDADGVIIKGHGRQLAAKRLNMPTVPVLVRSDLTPDQVKVARVSDNRVAVGGVDAELLKRELAEINFDLDGIFDAKELKFLEVDLGSIDTDKFVLDIDVEIDKQATESVRQVAEADSRAVKADKALGFKSVKGEDERHIARFMSLIEAETDQTGADAFVTFAKRYYEEATKKEGE